MNTTINKVLFIQFLEIYKRDGFIALILYILNAFNYRVINKYFRGSYSQKGEDLAIFKYFRGKKKGFYIDVGASHPERFNNTKFFYDKGWRGINIEPNPARIVLFKKERRRDTNLNLGIGSKKGKINFYEFESASLSTFSDKEARVLSKMGYPIKQKIKVPMNSLANVLKKYSKSKIDFMSVDTEGLDLDVLQSNNWKIYRPQLLCVETIDFIDMLSGKEDLLSRKKHITKYLVGKGYEEMISNGLNTIYLDTKS